MKVRPVSSASTMPNSDCARSTCPAPARISRSSASLPALPLARTISTAPASACGERRALRLEQRVATPGRERQHRVELVAAEGVALGGALDLDEAAAVVHHH